MLEAVKLVFCNFRERTKFEIFATLDFEPVLQMSPFALDHSVCKLPRFNMNFPPFDLGP